MKRILLTAAMAVIAACGAGTDKQIAPDAVDTTSAQLGMSWEDFMAKAVKVESETGFFLVDGDSVMENEKQLREFYNNHVRSGQLIVNKVGSADDRWDDTRKLNITYCIANTFNANKQAVIDAMASATGAWQAAANVKYVYVPAQDASCTASNNNVVFDVRPISGQQYLARAFFPGQARSSRNVIIDSSSFTQGNLVGIIRHELGHTLGFRHEHTRPESGTCFEDQNWRALTPYDSASVMHYPQCNGTGSFNSLQLTAQDKAGAAALYGQPGGGGGGGAGGGGGGSGGGMGGGGGGGGATSETFTGSLAQGESKFLAPFSVKAGSTIKVTMTGSGDPDLYLRFGAQPTDTQWSCRPYLDGATESCTRTVPAGQSQAYVAIDGFTAATYRVVVEYTKP